MQNLGIVIGFVRNEVMMHSHKRFYKIRSSTNFKEIGSFPQVQNIVRTHPDWGVYPVIDDMGNLVHDFQFPEYQLDNSSKPTDWVSMSGLRIPFIVVSKRFSNFIKSLNLFGLQIKSVKVYKNQILEDGLFACNIVPLAGDYIDWNNSCAFRTENFHKIRHEKYTFDSLDEYNHCLSYIRDNTDFGFFPCLKIKTDIPYDIFYMKTFGTPTALVCNEETRKAIEKEKFTGMQFVDITEKYFTP